MASAPTIPAGGGDARPPGQAQIERYGPLEMAVHVVASTPAFLVVTDTFYPGWHAYLDGNKRLILRGELLFRVVEVPAGSHQVVLRFEPGSVLVGLAISLSAVTLVLSALATSLRAPSR